MQTEHTLADAHNDADAARLRAAGFTYPEIAQQVGCAISTAHERVRRALKAVPADAVAELRQIEQQRLDDLWKIAWAIATRTHPLVSHGKIIVGENGKPLSDDGPKVQAVIALLRIQERRARLMGLDEPTKHRIEVISEDVVDKAIRELEEELAERAGDAVPAAD